MAKIVFFGTSDRSTPILESLKDNFDLVLCVTKEDVVFGRHQTPKETGVKSWCKANGVDFVTISGSISGESKSIIEHIKSSKAEVGIVADFGFIIPEDILNAFPRGLINIHFSLLPKYRGASPVQFAILNGDKETGITFQRMEYALDTGPIIAQIPYLLDGTETSGQLYHTLFELAGRELPKVVQEYMDGDITPKVQDESQASYTYSPTHQKFTYIFKEDAKLDWMSPVEKIDAAIRAYNPWPVTWTTLSNMQGAKEKIIGMGKIKDPKNSSKTVKIYDVKLVGNKIAIGNIQLEGGTILNWNQFKNGYLV